MSNREAQAVAVTRTGPHGGGVYDERRKDMMVPEFLRPTQQTPLARPAKEAEEEELTTLIPAGTFCR